MVADGVLERLRELFCFASRNDSVPARENGKSVTFKKWRTENMPPELSTEGTYHLNCDPVSYF